MLMNVRCLKQNVKPNPQRKVKMWNGNIVLTLCPLIIPLHLVLLNIDNQCRILFCLMLRYQISEISQQ